MLRDTAIGVFPKAFLLDILFSLFVISPFQYNFLRVENIFVSQSNVQCEEFLCSTLEPFVQCIPKYLRCDGNYDCLDHSDEEGCGKLNICLSKSIFSPSLYNKRDLLKSTPPAALLILTCSFLICLRTSLRLGG